MGHACNQVYVRYLPLNFIDLWGISQAGPRDSSYVVTTSRYGRLLNRTMVGWSSSLSLALPCWGWAQRQAVERFLN